MGANLNELLVKRILHSKKCRTILQDIVSGQYLCMVKGLEFIWLAEVWTWQSIELDDFVGLVQLYDFKLQYLT